MKREVKKCDVRVDRNLTISMIGYRAAPVWQVWLCVWVAGSASTWLTVGANPADYAPTTPSVSSSDKKLEGTCDASYEGGGCKAAISGDDAAECTLYLARSSIPGAGLGIFTTVAKKVGDSIDTLGDGCIPLIDLHWHHAQYDPHAGVHALDPFTDYLWSGQSMGMHEETLRNDVEALCPGLDCAINCHMGLSNVAKAIPKYDDGSASATIQRGQWADGGPNAGLNARHGNPGAGANSPYVNMSTVATRAIPAGSELFKAYGDGWFLGRGHIFGNIPLTDDYPRATELLAAFPGLQRNGSTAALLENALARELFESVIVAIKTRFDSRTLNALPNTWEEAVVAIEANDVANAWQSHHTVSLEYLKREGVCMDHITVKRSRLWQAGQGAFAKRSLSAGTIITKSPLLHILSHDWANMYNFSTTSTKLFEHHQRLPPHEMQRRQQNQKPESWIRLMNEVYQKQLVLNYCYGSRDSSLLLCPYGGGVNYINHNKALQNVRVEWATNFDIVHNDTAVQQGTIPDFEVSTRPQLAFQYIATRDIPAGEELYLDYGDEWETAWLDHVATYRERSSSLDPYISAQLFNSEFGDKPVRTEREQQMDPYPTNLQIRCHRALLVGSPPIPMPTARTVYRWSDRDYGLPCRVLDRFIEPADERLQEEATPPAAALLYTIQVEWLADEGEIGSPDATRTLTWIERTDVPRSAIRYFDVPGTTDLHQPAAFRHHVGIPDEIFPAQWRNLVG
jgi:SET domain